MSLDILEPAIVAMKNGEEVYLHPDHAISPETADRLIGREFLGKPTWMAENMFGGTPVIHPEMQKIYDSIPEHERIQIQGHMGVITTLANEGDTSIENHRRVYQQNERAIMSILKRNIIQERINGYEKSRTGLWVPLFGARFFTPMFAGNVGSIFETEMKRLQHPDGTFSVGYGDTSNADALRNIDHLLVIDDCGSTLMTVIVGLMRLKALGLAPKALTFGFTATTTGGGNELYRRLENDGYRGDSIQIATGAFCTRTNVAQYLMTADGKEFLVGNMGSGGWNEAVPGEEG